jgi:tRNA(adenine34) deaminase
MWKDIEKPWHSAFEQGWEAFRNGSIPIGAVIVDENMNIISTGRNRLFERGAKNPGTAHAEMDAIQKLDVSVYPNVKAYTLFTCMEPCPMCMGTIVMTSLRKLRVAARDGYCGSVHYCKDDPYIASKNMQASFYLGELETEHLALQTYFELRYRNGEMNKVTTIFEKDNPAAVEIAKSFYNNGYIEECVKKDVPFREVFDQITARTQSK